jgi:hypothetical protein
VKLQLKQRGYFLLELAVEGDCMQRVQPMGF